MPNTPNLGLPLLAAAQAQKHVTHNDALVGLDTLVQLAVVSKGLTAPPTAPAEGDRYLVAGANPTGAWTGWSGRIARLQDGQWVSYAPKPGWFAFVADENDLYTYTGSAWTSFRAVVYALTTLQNLTLLGVGTTADATNPFAAKLNKALWTAKPAGEGGTGDLRYTLNKEAPANTLSLLLQTAFSGRAEIGLTGDDDLHLKVSPDGAAWTEAVRIDRATGGVGFLAASTNLASAATTDLGSVASLKVDITGTTAISSFGTKPNVIKLVRFTGVLTLTHNAASLVLPGAANIATGAGDTAIVTSDASGNFRVRHYARADGTPVSTSLTLSSLNGGPLAGFRNRIVNGGFRVNQRAYVSATALAAGGFGHDRWKAGSAGCTYSFVQGAADTTITITAGTLVQVVEDASVEGGAYTLSWTGTAQARIAASGGGPSGAYAGSPLTVMGAGAGQAVTVEFAAGTLGKVQLEPGVTASPFERRPIAAELLLCQRYFERIAVPLMQSPSAGSMAQALSYKVAKRTTPTTSTVTAPTYSNASGAAFSVSTVDGLSLQFTAGATGAFLYGWVVDASAEL